MERRKSRKIKLGNTTLGGDSPVLVQSMLNVPSTNIDGSVAQAKALAAAGCQVIRFAIPDEAALDLIEPIKNAVDVPLVADIHFNYRLGAGCCPAGDRQDSYQPGQYRQRRSGKSGGGYLQREANSHSHWGQQRLAGKTYFSQIRRAYP